MLVSYSHLTTETDVNYYNQILPQLLPTRNKPQFLHVPNDVPCSALLSRDRVPPITVRSWRTITTTTQWRSVRVEYFWGRQSCRWWAYFLDSQPTVGTHSERHQARAILAALITGINQPPRTSLALGDLVGRTGAGPRIAQGRERGR